MPTEPRAGRVTFYNIFDQFGVLVPQGGNPNERLTFGCSDLPSGQFVVPGDVVQFQERSPRARPGASPERRARVIEILGPVTRSAGTVTAIPTSGTSTFALKTGDGSTLSFSRNDMQPSASLHVGDKVEYTLDGGKPHDISIERAMWLTTWAYFVSVPASLKDLEKLALPGERWRFGTATGGFPKLLWGYLYYTYFKLRLETKVIEAGEWATFNTGLVDKMYKDIFLLFRRRDQSGPRELAWAFQGFGCSGEPGVGQQLTRLFGRKLPEPASYFGKVADVVLDVGEPVAPSGKHIVIDNVDRFPADFLRRHLPNTPVTTADFAQLRQWLQSNQAGSDALLHMYEDLERAISRAMKRVSWNFKTAVPMWYPPIRRLQLLLPLSLGRDPNKVDRALVVERTESGAYIGHTILHLEWAYKNARLVCRPDSDWLAPQLIAEETQEALTAGAPPLVG